MSLKPRDFGTVVRQMIDLIPIEMKDFREALEWNIEDGAYKAPEEIIQWQRTSCTLQRFIPLPKKDWEWQVLSLFTMVPIEELKKSQ